MLRVVLAVALLAFTVYCVVDAVQTENEKVRGLPKIAWVLVVLLFPLAGGIAWMIAGRPRGILTVLFGEGGRSGPPRGPRGPDDDPDFLRDL